MSGKHQAAERGRRSVTEPFRHGRQTSEALASARNGMAPSGVGRDTSVFRHIMKEKIKIMQPEEPIPAEVIATAIVNIAESMLKLNSTRLTRRAIVTLIHENSGVARKTIEVVLNNLEQLEETWLKRKI
jgi:hypothetical protein